MTQLDSGSTDGLHRLEGPERVALRRPGRPTWLLVDRTRLVAGAIPLGMRVELDREDHGRHDTPASQRALKGSGLPFGVPSVPAALAWVWAALGLLLTLVSIIGGSGRPTLAVSEGVSGFVGLGVSAALVLATFCALRVLEGALLARVVESEGGWIRLRGAVVQVEPVAWRLGIPASVPGALICAGVATALLSTALLNMAPAAAVGVGAGSVLYLVQALYPLRPGPGAAVLESLFRTRDLPAQLRWSLLSRFVPVPSNLEVAGSASMGWLALIFVGWTVATVAALAALAAPPSAGATPAAKLWEVGFTLALLAYGVWLISLTFELFLTALQLRPGAALKPLAASEASVGAWHEHNPVIRHMPELRDAEWRWGTAPRGAVLIRFGSDDQRFLWLVSGRAHILGRTEAGDPRLVAELQPGSGVGEVALLGDGTRTADVIASEDCVVAVLRRQEFESIAGEETRRSLRDLAQASQSLARSRALWGLFPDDRARWLAEGEPREVREGETLIEQGEAARWMGLVVRGGLDVAIDGEPVTRLGTDDLFGEMAYLDGAPRSATLTATENTLVWTWSEGFLDEAVGSGEVRDALRRLAEERSR